MNKIVSKLLILAISVGLAIGSILYFIKYVVSPPDSISAISTAENVFYPDIENLITAYNPDSLSLKDAEVSFDVLVDRITIFREDELITDETFFDKTVAELSDKFAQSFVKWATHKFDLPTWNSNDHVSMKRIINKLRNITVAQGSKKALGSDQLESLTKIENTINDYNLALVAAKQTSFVPWNFNDARTKRKNAEGYAKKDYLKNCVNLVNSLNSVGGKLEYSCYNQLHRTVETFKYLYNYKNRQAYEFESNRINGLINEFEKSDAFGVSTSAHAKALKQLKASYDRASENHSWLNEKVIVKTSKSKSTEEQERQEKQEEMEREFKAIEMDEFFN